MKIKLSDDTLIYDLLEHNKPIKDRFLNTNTIGLRIHGLIGDCIKATTILSTMIKEDPTRSYVILVSYNDASKIGIIKDLFTDLVNAGKVVGLFLNEYSIIGNISFAQFTFLKELGCKTSIDLYYHSSDSYKKLKTGIAYLGFPQPEPNKSKVALLRYSGFHKHVPLRHIPEMSWLELEEYLIGLGLDVHLYGYDDDMKTLVNPENDHRKRMSVLETIKHASNSGICISTTTFLPHYLHHFVNCLVFCDPVDLPALCLQWRNTHKYMPVNTQMPDYLMFVKDYVSMWYLANLNVNAVLKNMIVGVQDGRESNL